jgi:hypothetical protein
VSSGPASGSPLALHVSPHPDDEAIAAPAALLALRDAGLRVRNLLVTLGRPADRERRFREAEEAARRQGFELEQGDDVAAVLAREPVAVLVGPGPHDGHRGHEPVGRAIRDALEDAGEEGPRWWMWGLWADLPHPTLYVPFGEERMAEVLHGLDAYGGELARNDYARLVRGRAQANAVLGSERAFGSGSAAASTEPYAELLCELAWRGARWRAGAPRLLDPADPLAEMGEGADLTWWLGAPSFRDRLG